MYACMQMDFTFGRVKVRRHTAQLSYANDPSENIRADFMPNAGPGK